VTFFCHAVSRTTSRLHVKAVVQFIPWLYHVVLKLKFTV